MCNCGKKTVVFFNGKCDVCEDGIVKSVYFCQVCNANICKKHRNDYLSRGWAAIKKTIKKIT